MTGIIPPFPCAGCQKGQCCDRPDETCSDCAREDKFAGLRRQLNALPGPLSLTCLASLRGRNRAVHVTVTSLEDVLYIIDYYQRSLAQSTLLPKRYYGQSR